jgi:hypothetical protein
MMRSWIFVAGALLLASTRCEAAGARCPAEAGLHSIEGNILTFVNFANGTGMTVRTYWINYQGQRQFYAEIPAGQSYRQQTYVTHPWVVTDSSENCLKVYMPQPSESTVTIP